MAQNYPIQKLGDYSDTGPFPRIVGVEWRSARHTVGIVAVQTGPKRWKAYIGPTQLGQYDCEPITKAFEDVLHKDKEVLKESGGDAEVADARIIAATGAKLGEAEARAFFVSIPKDWEYEYGLK